MLVSVLALVLFASYFLFSHNKKIKNAVNNNYSGVGSAPIQNDSQLVDINIAVPDNTQATNSANIIVQNIIQPETTTLRIGKIPVVISELKNTTTTNKITIVQLPSEVMAWVYPGNPTCAAKREYSDGRRITILKPEYFNIDENGQLILLTEKNNGCNGYSLSNVADLKKYSTQQYVTISSSYAVSMNLFLDNSLDDSNNIDTLVSFVVDNNLTGLEIDFEDFGGWDKEVYDKYKKFLLKLGTALHEKKKKLMIDGPATSNVVEDAWYVWRYSDFNNLPVDKIVVMAYDYQYDQGAGQPVSPIAWIKNTINWTLKKIDDKSKLSLGIPSYGYKGSVGAHKFSLLTYEQIKKEPGFDTATRDPESFEMTWSNGNNIYFYQDAESMSKKLQTIQAAGIKSVSVWHLGGNLWFNN